MHCVLLSLVTHSYMWTHNGWHNCLWTRMYTITRLHVEYTVTQWHVDRTCHNDIDIYFVTQCHPDISCATQLQLELRWTGGHFCIPTSGASKTFETFMEVLTAADRNKSLASCTQIVSTITQEAGWRSRHLRDLRIMASIVKVRLSMG